MSAYTTDDRWTCPSCGGTVPVRDDRARRALQRRRCPHDTAVRQLSTTGHPTTQEPTR